MVDIYMIRCALILILGGVERAAWNVELEKSLVDLLFEHNMPPHRAQNGWSPDAWNKIVSKFHKKHEYVTFNKIQIQEKERELKREYKILKEARKQSGVSWNEKRCMIIAEPTIWDNIITVRSICFTQVLISVCCSK
jgi:hypothetical protein